MGACPQQLENTLHHQDLQDAADTDVPQPLVVLGGQIFSSPHGERISEERALTARSKSHPPAMVRRNAPAFRDQAINNAIDQQAFGFTRSFAIAGAHCKGHELAHCTLIVQATEI